MAEQQDDELTAEFVAAFMAAWLAAQAGATPGGLSWPGATLTWESSVDDTLLPALGEVFDRAALRAPVPAPPSAPRLRAAREEYLAQVRGPLLHVMANAVDEADTVDEAAPRWRAERAARTEAWAAHNAGEWSAAPANRFWTWRTRRDERVRGAHRAMDGVSGPPFDIQGYPARFPGDPLLPAHLRIGCRCTLRYAAPAITADGGPMPMPVAAGIMLLSMSTGRVLLAQRCLCDEKDPGLWEAPGGKLDDGEDPYDGAVREWLEETGLALPDDVEQYASWTSPDGVYRGFVLITPHEISLHDRDMDNPDDPDEEAVAALAWFDPADLPPLRPVVAEHTPWALLELPSGEDYLSEEEVVALLERVEQEVVIDPLGETMTAAGGADRNRGNAERLRHYWTTGPGGARIGWGTPGDWTRCVGELTEHLGPRAKGYCALRHRETTGVWPGDRDNLAASAQEDDVTTAPLSKALELIAELAPLLKVTEPEPLTAASEPYPGEPVYDASWFMDPLLAAASPITIEGSRVYGHLADWTVCHRSFKQCRTAPRSRSGYQEFHVGEVLTSAGPMAAGSLVLATGHADLSMTASAASQHYADSGSAVAVVRAGEDRHGIWVAGAIIDGTDPRDVAALRRCPLSGDWRDVRGNSELVAALAVNVPGLPIARERWRGKRQVAMVAAGALPNPLWERLDRTALDLRAEALAERVALG